ncbi:MAG: hypothetical protein AAGB31_08970 [Bdellovibrio sp.]
MSKILLVYEDYADLMAVESALKKVGFDVLGLSSEYSVAEQVLAFNPELVIGSGRGGKVSSLGVGKRLKEMSRWQGKAILIFPAHFHPEAQDLIRIRVDMVLEAPVPLVRLVQIVGRVLGVDESVLLERYNRALQSEGSAQEPSNLSSLGSHRFTTDEEAIYIKGSSSDPHRRDNFPLQPERVSDDETGPASSRSMAFRFGDRVTKVQGGSEKASSGEDSEFSDVDLKALEAELLGGGVPPVERVESFEVEPTPLVEESEPAVREVGSEPEAVESEEDAAAIEVARGVVEESSSEDGVVESELSASLEPEVPQDIVSASDSVSAEESEEEALRRKAQQELLMSELELHDRVSKYNAIVADVKVAPKSTVTRVEARRRLKQMSEDWDPENLKKLDELRREFVKGLFKK